jgi:hypothetical protein
MLINACLILEAWWIKEAINICQIQIICLKYYNQKSTLNNDDKEN